MLLTSGVWSTHRGQCEKPTGLPAVDMGGRDFGEVPV